MGPIAAGENAALNVVESYTVEIVRGHDARRLRNTATGEAVPLASGLGPAPAGKAYELWIIAKAAPVPAGVFQVDAQGRAVFRLPAGLEFAGVKTFAVTLEPETGVPAPTGPDGSRRRRFLRASLSR